MHKQKPLNSHINGIFYNIINNFIRQAVFIALTDKIIYFIFSTNIAVFVPNFIIYE